MNLKALTRGGGIHVVTAFLTDNIRLRRQGTKEGTLYDGDRLWEWTGGLWRHRHLQYRPVSDGPIRDAQNIPRGVDAKS